jgi:hypothetical protein
MDSTIEQRKQDISDYVRLQIWPLNPSGNFNNVLDLFISIDASDAPVYTAEIVGQRYIDYFNKWSYEHTDIDERYIRSDDKLLDIIAFMMKRGYQNEYSIIRKGRDFYLFGDMLKEELKSKLVAYKKSIAHGRK